MEGIKMKTTSPFVITISRQLGAGGAYIGQQLAKNLNIFYADRQIINEAANQLKVPEDDLKSRDEKISSILQSFRQLYAISPVYYLPRQIIGPTDRELFKTESEIIASIAKERSAVIMGRCGSYILHEHPNHVSIFLHADITFRKGRLEKLHDLSEREAEEMIIQNDKDRAQYNHKFTGKEWTDARLYDITIDTGKMGLDKSVEFLMKYLERT